MRRREGPGQYDGLGEFVPGPVVETELRASVQPLGTEDAELEGGSQLSARLAVWIPEPDALAAAFDDARADEVVYRGDTYVVTESFSWPNHTEARLLRET